jgi:hypothetical protein
MFEPNSACRSPSVINATRGCTVFCCDWRYYCIFVGLQVNASIRSINQSINQLINQSINPFVLIPWFPPPLPQCEDGRLYAVFNYPLERLQRHGVDADLEVVSSTRCRRLMGPARHANLDAISKVCVLSLLLLRSLTPRRPTTTLLWLRVQQAVSMNRPPLPQPASTSVTRPHALTSAANVDDLRN